MKIGLFSGEQMPLAVYDAVSGRAAGSIQFRPLRAGQFVVGDNVYFSNDPDGDVSWLEERSGRISEYYVINFQYAGSFLKSLRDYPTTSEALLAKRCLKHDVDFFYCLHGSKLINCDHINYWSDSDKFSSEKHRSCASYLSDNFGIAFFSGAMALMPDVVRNRRGEFIADPLPMLRYSGAGGAGACYDHFENRVLYRSMRSTHISGVVLLLSKMNYGHWFAQNLPQIFALKELVEAGVLDANNVCVAINGQSSHPLLRKYLKAINFDLKVIDPSAEGYGAITADKIALGSTCQATPPFYWPEYIGRSLQPFRSSFNKRGADKVIFISRGDVDNKRGLLNEDALVKALGHAGIELEVVQGAKLTVEEQQNVFSQAKLVIGPHGSGLNNAFFAHQDCGVLEIISEAVEANRNWFQNMFTAAGQPYMAVNVGCDAGADWNSPFSVNIDAVVSMALRFLEPCDHTSV